MDETLLMRLTPKRKAKILRELFETLRKERLAIAGRKDAHCFSIWLKARKRLDAVLSVRNAGPEYKGFRRRDFAREFMIDADVVYGGMLSLLPDETQWELAKLLQERFDKNKKLKLKVSLKSKFAKQI